MTEDLYNQLVGMLGSLAKNRALDEISRELRAAPKQTTVTLTFNLNFLNTDFSLMVLNGQIYSVLLHGDTVQTRFKGWAQFGNPLPKQIKFGYSRSDVHAKLGEPTSATRLEQLNEMPGDYFDDYSIDASVARYIFDSRRQLLCAIAIRCNDAHEPAFGHHDLL